MTEITTIEALSDRLLAMARGTRRCFVALAGLPGAGKSHIAENLSSWLAKSPSTTAEILPMDGYHCDDLLLEARCDRLCKGAPHSLTNTLRH